MTERERWGLRGPVRSCRLERTWYSRCCRADKCETDERSDTTVLEFREDGRLTSHRHQNPDGSEWKSIHQYDAAGRLMTVRSEDTTGVRNRQRYEYDAEGRVGRIVDCAEDGSERVAETFEYETSGRKKKTFYVDLAAQRQDVQYFWGADGTDSGFSAPGAATLTTLHNTRDQPTELVFHDQAGRALSRVEFLYDDDGHLIEEAQFRIADVLPPQMLASMNPAQLEAVRALFGVNGEPTRRLHRYDARGRRIETRSSMFGPVGQDRRTMTYNEHDDQIAEISEDERREYDINDTGKLRERPDTETVSRSEARFRYDYDVHGNWVKKVVEGRGGTDNDFSVSVIEQRTLAYYV